MSSSAVYNKSYDKNTVECTVGDGQVVASRKGGVAMASPAARAYFVKMRQQLAMSTLDKFELFATQRQLSTGDHACVVSMKMTFKFNGQEILRNLMLSIDGEWNPKDSRTDVLNLEKDDDTRIISELIATDARTISGKADWGYTKNGDPINPEDMVLRQIREILKPELKKANDRLAVEVDNLIATPDLVDEARRTYEDFMRDKVHKALQAFEKIGPDALHRFVDEMYCKKIHDS
jgi:hypothetical protein